MSSDLGRLECRICGRSIYFPQSETVVKHDARLIELTCSRGHTDSYWDLEAHKLENIAPHAEAALAAAVGF